jgi:putative LysE/RhtB family amino acid efflux pump
MVGAAGAAPALSVGVARTVLGVAGAAILIALGARTLWTARRVRAGFETPGEAISPRRAFATALAATASNPLTIASWAAIFAAASGGHAGPRLGSTLALLGGIGAGSMAAGTALAVAVALLRRRLGSRALRAVDAGAGAALVGFGGALGYRTLHD